MEKINLRPAVIIFLALSALTILVVSSAIPRDVVYAVDPTPTQANHFYIVPVDGFIYAEDTQCGVPDSGPFYLDAVEHPDELYGVIASVYMVGSGSFKFEETDNGATDSITWTSSSGLSYSGRYCFSAYGPYGSTMCDKFSATIYPPSGTAFSGGSTWAINAGETGFFGMSVGANCGQSVELLANNFQFIYYGNNEPAGACSEDFYLGSSSTGNIPATASSGAALPVLTPGTWYAIETDGGPWYNNGGPALYTVQVSKDNGVSWAGLGSDPFSDCITQVGSNYVRVYFQAQSGAEYKLRVADPQGAFGDNTGSMDYTLYSAVDISGEEQRPLCDGDMQQYPISDCWLPGEGYPPNNDGFGRDLAPSWSGVDQGACGNAFQTIGAWVDLGPPPYDTVPDIWQDFTWSGGPMYYSYSVRGNDQTAVQTGSAYYNIYIYGTESIYPFNYVDGLDLTGQEAAPGIWYDVAGVTDSLPPGNYRIGFEMDTALSDPNYDSFHLDDVLISSAGNGSNCDPGPTPTVTPTQLPSTPTPNPDLDNYIDNCSFEQGNANWNFTGSSQVIYGGTYSAADGDNYALAPLTTDQITQLFSWPGGVSYIRFFGMGNGSVRLKNYETGQTYYVDDIATIGGSWAQYDVILPDLPTGLYNFVFYGETNSLNGGWLDAIVVSDNGFFYCTDSSGGVTATPPPTFTPGPTHTPVPTLQPTNTNTPFPTWSPQPTYTPYPTNTPPPTSTTGPGTPTSTPPPTYTPPPTSTPWPVPQPNQQPPASCDVTCIRPINPMDLAGWSEYNRCESQKWVSFCDYHAATAVAIPNEFNGSEPFGTINELNDTAQGLQDLINSYDWNTGINGVDQVPDYSNFGLGDQSPYNNGSIDLFPSDSVPYSTVCEAELTAVVGERLGVSMCFIFNILNELALLPWFQLFVNMSMLGVLGLWLYNKLIDPAFE